MDWSNKSSSDRYENCSRFFYGADKLKFIRTFFNQYSPNEATSGRTMMHAAEGEKGVAFFIAKRDRDGNTLLHLAIENNETEVFNLLIEECNVNVKNIRHQTPLHYAAANNRIQFTKVLIENGAMVNVEDIEQKTPLHLALTNQNVQLSKILFKNGAVISNRHFNLFRPLHSAAESGNLEIVKLLMMNGCNTVDGITTYNCPLTAAVISGHLEVVKYLMKNGSKDNKTITEDRFNLLVRCVKPDQFNIFKYLVSVGVKTKRTILSTATYWKRYNIWKYSLKCISKLNLNTRSIETELHSAIRAREVETVKIIVAASNVEPNSLACKLAVYIAVENNSEEILEVLLNAKYSVEGFEKVSPLHIASTFDSTRLVKMLLKAGADINSRTGEGFTPLHFAAAALEPTIVKLLLKKGADPHITCDYNSSPLSFALSMLTGRYETPLTITTLMFKKILKIMEILFFKESYHPKVTEGDLNNMFSITNRMWLSRDKSKESTSNSMLDEETSNGTFENISTSQSPFGMLKLIFNYLKKDKEEHYFLLRINDKWEKSNNSPELFHILMEYNNFKSCSEIEIRLYQNSYECNLLLIDYADSVNNLTNVEIQYNFDPSYKLSAEDETVYLKLIVARLLLLITEDNLILLEFCRKHNLNDWRQECERQKVIMKNTKVEYSSNISFYDILTERIERFSKYTENKNFLKIVESSYIKFPAYAEFLRIYVEKCRRRNDLMEECMDSMFVMVKINYKIQMLNDDCNPIFQYLSVADLRRLLAACS
ncbi:alpha-latrocrustotoxin-Lt1a-like [Leptopilina heterotoma]|uniref:alpha-latrocrustotoxin-Lt1a-like n=1 Tax=Leptopilina heterotoma TaxID=63436 RepID=UPI001CA8CC19|nr:alpha-latrocrustotoxin-Lt1a-like [Leptopilina heterotoma]